MTRHEEDMARCAKRIGALIDYIVWQNEALIILGSHDYDWPEDYLLRGQRIRAKLEESRKAKGELQPA